ncbi:MAG: hypothetical protein DRI69_11955 [Bacteroidetes bacterium]|nr:MAG: hypothetical protein DRI69_11955 [Bacteroidota bacterium]
MSNLHLIYRVSSRMMKVLSSVVAIFLINVSSIAQPLKEVPTYMHIEVAEERMETGDYYNALEQYEEAYKQERSEDLRYKIALLHYQMRDFKRAERWLARVIANDETAQYPDAVLKYALTLKMAGKHEEAIEALNVYAGMVDDEVLLKKADIEFEGIQLAMESEVPIELVIEHMGRKVNTRYSEFGPAMHPDGELYIGALPGKEVKLLTDAPFAQIYKTELDKKEKWEKPKALPDKINRPGYHTANPRFSDDGTRMYFTRALMEGDDLVESKIFTTTMGKSSWGAANEVVTVNGDYIATHPTIGYLLGNEVMIFSSDMDGGEGGFDLFYSLNVGGDFSAPVNLGAIINTPYDEVTPYFHDNTLYFSSDGLPSMGGLDIFYVEWDGSNWSDPKNLGAGYNSGYDDWYFNANEEGTRGFVVSNRPSDDSRSVKSKTCCDDIYTFEIRQIVLDLLTNVFDDETKEALTGAKVTKFEVLNNRPGKSQSKSNEISNDFNFLLDPDKSYKVTVERDGYYPKEFEFNTVGFYEERTFTSDIFLEKAPSEDTDTRTVVINEPIRLNNIYYDFDDDKILQDAEKDLETIMNLMDEYPTMVIELSSHTDAQGNDAYNERLSQRRAQSAVDWLISAGIEPDRMEAVGYGENQILNKCVNGVRCTDDEHRYNRRTEFKIIAGPTSIEIKTEVLPESEKKN